MVGHLRVVDKALVRMDRFFQKLRRKRPVGSDPDRLQTLLQRRHDILCDVSGIRAGIGQYLVVLVQALHDIQRLLGGKAVLLPGLPLQGRQVIQPRCRDRTLPSVHRRDGEGQVLLSGKTAGQSLRLLLIEGTAAAGLCILPDELHVVGLDADAVVFLRRKIPYLFFSFSDDGQCRRLYPSAGKLRVVFARQRPRPVHADQPVRLRPRGRGPVQVVVLAAVPERGKALADRLVRHRGDPQPSDRLVAAGLLKDPPGDQLALPSGVRCDDHLGHVRAEQLFFDSLELLSALGDHHQLLVVGKHGQRAHVPFFIFFIIGLRIRQRHQVAQGPGDDILRSLQGAGDLLAAVKDPGDVPPDGGLLRQNNCFHSLLLYDPGTYAVLTIRRGVCPVILRVGAGILSFSSWSHGSSGYRCPDPRSPANGWHSPSCKEECPPPHRGL